MGWKKDKKSILKQPTDTNKIKEIRTDRKL